MLQAFSQIVGYFLIKIDQNIVKLSYSLTERYVYEVFTVYCLKKVFLSLLYSSLLE